MNLNNLFEAANLAQQAAIAIAKKKAGKKPKNEGAEFGAYYSEQVAQEIFNKRQDISSEDEILNQAYHIVANDQGQRSARYMLNYDADFPSDVVSNYFHLQKQSLSELDEACWKGYHKEGNKKMFGKTYPNCVKNTNEEQELEEKWSQKYKDSINCSNPKGFSQKAHCASKNKNEDIQEEKCPHCGGEMVSEELMNEKKDACYYKVKSRYKVWPSAYASGALVKCRKKGADSWGEGGKKLKEFAPDDGDGGEEETLHKYARMWYNGDLGTQQQVEQILDRMGWEIGELESEEGGAFVVQAGDENGNSYIGFTADDLTNNLDENLHKWFKEKWVRFGPDGKIRGDCARGDDSEGKPKCLPQSKAHSLGKKGRASAAARKRREDPNPERSGKAINVNTKKKSNEGVTEGSQQVDSLVTDALKLMRGSEVSDAVSALKTVLGNREYNGRRGHYNFYVRQLMDMYGQQGIGEGAPVTTTPGSIEPGGAVDNFKQQMANNTEIDYQKKQQGVAEAGYSNYDDNRTGFRRPPREDDEGHEQDRHREQQEKSGTWYIRLNGKLIKDKQGMPYSYRGKAAANKAALTMQAKLFNQGKEFMLTTNPNDKVAESQQSGYGRGYASYKSLK